MRSYRSKFHKFTSEHSTPVAGAIGLLVIGLIGLFTHWGGYETALSQINSYVWILSNVLILYIGVVLVIFVTAYYFLFNPNATTGGRFIFRFSVSLVGVMGLIFIGIFLNPTSGANWFEYPGDAIWWRPSVRMMVYGYVAYTTTALTHLLYLRKFKPHRLRTAADLALVQPRHDDKF